MKLFEPVTINGLTVPNRLVKSAMAEGLADELGHPLPELTQLYQRWAKGGVGLLITGMAHIRKGYAFTDREIGLYDDSLVAPLKPLVECVHRYGSRIFVQICHAVPQIPRRKAQHFGAVAPSLGFSLTNFLWHHSLSERQIWEIIRDFRLAARRAREAGFDGIQLHAAHGYLLSRMISPRTNRRHDRWGRNFEGRLAFLGEVVSAIRSEVGRDYPLTVKLNVHDGDSNGYDLSQGVRVAKRLEECGIDAIEVSAGTADVGMGFYPSRGGVPMDLSLDFIQREFPSFKPILPVLRPLIGRATKQVALQKEAYFLDEAKAVAAEVSVPVICVGGIRSRQTAEQILDETPISMISLARPLIREPALPKAWQRGTLERTRCTSCNRCLVSIGLGKVLRCWCE